MSGPFCQNPECPLSQKIVDDQIDHLEIVERSLSMKLLTVNPTGPTAVKETKHLFKRELWYANHGKTRFWLCHECAEVPQFVESTVKALGYD